MNTLMNEHSFRIYIYYIYIFQSCVCIFLKERTQVIILGFVQIPDSPEEYIFNQHLRSGGMDRVLCPNGSITVQSMQIGI